MKRRSMLPAIAALALPNVALAAPPVVGWLAIGTSELARPGLQEVMDELARRGFRSGRNIAFEPRYANLQPDRLPALASELVAMRPTLIVAAGHAAVKAVAEQTRDIPIVMFGASNPVQSGFAATLARPGGNVTGVTNMQLDLAGKGVELLRSIDPRIARITVVWNPEGAGMAGYKPFADRAAARLRVEFTYVDVRQPEDFRAEAVDTTRPHALVFPPDAVLTKIADQVMRYAIERRLPTITYFRGFAGGAALLTLEPELREMALGTAEYVDRILRGAKPATMPVLEPARFQLAVNLKTAKRIGVQVPQAVLVQADGIVE